MNKKITYSVLIIVVIIAIMTIITVSALKQPNDYYAFVADFVDFHSVNETEMNISYQVRYIPVTASATYTFTLAYETTLIDLDQPSTIQSKMRQDITDDSIARGYNLKKIIIPDYNIMPPLVP